MIRLYQNKLDEFVKLIQNSHKISIIGHSNPDADAISSVLALYHILNKLNKNVTPVLPDEPPKFLTWIPTLDKVSVGQKASDFILNSQLIICLDFNETKRAGDLETILTNSYAKKILIDHHPNPENFAQISFSYPSASSTAELIFLIVNKIFPKLIDKHFASLIYTGLLADTGCFCHDSTNSQTFKIASQLLKYGINKAEIVSNLYNSFSFNRMKLMGYVLYNNLKIIPEYNFGYISLSLEEMKRFGYQTGDHENFANLPLSIKQVLVSAMFLEQEDVIRVSLRSKGKINVGKLAQKYLNGGGHKNAAGGSLEPPLYKAIDYFVKNIVPLINKFKEE